MTSKNIYIIASTFYPELSNELINGASAELINQWGADSRSRLKIIEVPGAFEIPGMTKQILECSQIPDLIITLGVLVKGETNHFEYISKSVSDSISKLNISSNVPIIFGVITALNYDQASERALTTKKNKGAEVMGTGLRMLELYEQYKK